MLSYTASLPLDSSAGFGRHEVLMTSNWSWPRTVDGFGLEIHAAGACSFS